MRAHVYIGVCMYFLLTLAAAAAAAAAAAYHSSLFSSWLLASEPLFVSSSLSLSHTTFPSAPSSSCFCCSSLTQVHVHTPLTYIDSLS